MKNKFLSFLFFSFLYFTGIGLTLIILSSAAFAKFCPSCGTYNSDINPACIKCSKEFSQSEVEKKKIGIIFFSSMYPADKAKFTVYYKSSVTPFFVWNPKGRYEIGETRLPVDADLEFLSIKADDMPTEKDVVELSEKYGLEKLLVVFYHSQRIERLPIISSQFHNVYLDVFVYDSKGAELRRKTYCDELKGWPNPGIPYVADVANSLWEQMTRDMRLILSN